ARWARASGWPLRAQVAVTVPAASAALCSASPAIGLRLLPGAGSSAFHVEVRSVLAVLGLPASSRVVTLASTWPLAASTLPGTPTLQVLPSALTVVERQRLAHGKGARSPAVTWPRRGRARVPRAAAFDASSRR